jgi:hypothetical protein
LGWGLLHLLLLQLFRQVMQLEVRQSGSSSSGSE